MRCEDVIRALQCASLPSPLPPINSILDTTHGWTLLHLTIVYGTNVTTGQYENLLRRGASWSIKSKYGVDALDLALTYKRKAFFIAMIAEMELATRRMKDRATNAETDLAKLRQQEIELKTSYSGIKRKLDELTNEHKNLEDSFNGLADTLRKKRKLNH